MRPEDIKVGTVFKNNLDNCRISIVTALLANKEVESKSVEFGMEGSCSSYFYIGSPYCENNLTALFVPKDQCNEKCNKEDLQSNGDLILPPYYATDTPYEPFNIADFYNMNIREFSALKYLLRSKDESKRVEDLKKAITCIHKEIIRLESLKESGN